MATTGPQISTEELSHEFGDIRALDGINLTVEESTIIGIAGPNGSGKTTLIRCLLGLLVPTAGHARLNGSSAEAFDADDRRRIGYMPQREAVYPELTVRGNVSFFARLYGVSDRAEAVDRVLSFVDLRDRADSRIQTLSGGMVRRVSLACAMVHEPSVLLLDEPTVGLDPELRATMWEGFRTRRDEGAIVVVSTHYLGEAGNCDRVLLLRAGSVLAFETPNQLLDRTGAADLESAFLAMLQQGSGER